MPLAIDLFSGLGGWAEGLEAEGWSVRRYDIADMFEECGVPKPDGLDLVLRDVLTIHGAELIDADLIVASPPCQEYSYMAMPWTRAKAKADRIRADETGAELERLNALFNACFRIQRECNEARAAKGLPPVKLVVENVRGAVPWVGLAAWNFGSYYLWGDVPALMPVAIAGRKVPGFRFDGSGGSFQTAAVNTHVAEGRKGAGAGAGAGAVWFDQNPCQLPSSSPRRKAASAKIAKIPEALSRHIGRVYHPDGKSLAEPWTLAVTDSAQRSLFSQVD